MTSLSKNHTKESREGNNTSIHRTQIETRLNKIEKISITRMNQQSNQDKCPAGVSNVEQGTSHEGTWKPHNPAPLLPSQMEVSENRGPYYSTLDSRILIIRTPK